MAKPMLVTLPLVMLLLDYWPLGRAWENEIRPPSPRPSPPGEGDHRQAHGQGKGRVAFRHWLAMGFRLILHASIIHNYFACWRPLVVEKNPDSFCSVWPPRTHPLGAKSRRGGHFHPGNPLVKSQPPCGLMLFPVFEKTVLAGTSGHVPPTPRLVLVDLSVSSSCRSSCQLPACNAGGPNRFCSSAGSGLSSPSSR